MIDRIQAYINNTVGRVEKRIRFVAGTMILTSVMLFTTFFFFDKVWIFLPLILLLSYGITYLSIVEDIKEVEWIMLFLMPAMLTASSYLFYFLFPVRWITRIPFIVLFGFSIYAVLLTSNIFNVGVGRSIQLYRAAFSVNYFYQTLITFLMFNVLFSFKQGFIVNGLVIFAIIFPLSAQLLWSIKPKIHFDAYVKNYSLLSALLIAEIGIVFSFIPVKSTILALFLTACYYSLLGLIYHYLDQRLFRQTVREYIFVLGFVCIVVFLSIQW